jgi:hypothetical protein
MERDRHDTKTNACEHIEERLGSTPVHRAEMQLTATVQDLPVMFWRMVNNKRS